LVRRDIAGFRRETFDSALKLGADALQLLGFEESRAKQVASVFAKHDEDSLYKLAEVWGDDKSYGIAIRQRMEDLQQVLDEDAAQFDEAKNISKDR